MPVIVKRILFITYLLVIMIVAVFPFSAAGVDAMNRVHIMTFRLDHLLHVLAFVPLYPLAYWLFHPHTWQQRHILLSVSLLIAASAEYVQYFIAYRAWNPADLISNLTGVMLGFIVIFVVRKWQRIN